MTRKDHDIIGDIEKIRSENNNLWMDILRIAMETDPGRTKSVLRRINRNDREIGQKLAQLAQ